MKITVLCGGISPERSISLISGAMISNALKRKGHLVACADLCRDVTDADAFKSEPTEVPTLYDAALDIPSGTSQIGKGILELCYASDIVFPALHGGMGEDGRLQAFLELHGIMHTGATYLPCALAMHKGMSKALLASHGIPVPRGITATPDTPVSDIVKAVRYPCVIKPMCGGSSVGISFAQNDDELKKALSSAFVHDREAIIEEKLVGRELTVGILMGKALPAVEIKPKQGFYDYKNKYIKGLTEEICPAPLTESEASLLSDTALGAARALGIDAYCRVDMILTDDGIPCCLEVNTLPGMTETSLLPQEAAALGTDFDELCEQIIDEALMRENRK